MKKLLTIASTTFTSIFISLFVVGPVFADQNTSIQPPADTGIVSNLTVNSVVRFVIYALFAIAVLAALFFLIWGGIRWIISGGEKEKVEEARKQIIAAIIGLIIVVLAWVILNFVLQVFTGHGITDLCIPSLSQAGTICGG
jgi:hypothetical protein